MEYDRELIAPVRRVTVMRTMQEVYESLHLNSDVGEIRTVKIERGFGDEIVCNLEKLVLPQPGIDAEGKRNKPIQAKYTALSYMWDYKTPSIPPLNLWGRTNQPKKIKCNGVFLTVTPNLYAALRQLRHEKESTVLWVDALCINQKGDNEKTGQVALMGKIYALAEKTVVWLGEGTYLSAQGFKAAHFLAGMKRSSILSDSPNHQQAPRGATPNSSTLAASHSTTRIALYIWAFTLLLRNPYFTRIWIVQEIGLGMNLEIRSREEFISLGDFALAALVLAFSKLGSKSSLNITNILAVRSLVRGRPRQGIDDPSWVHAESAKRRLPLGRDILSTMNLFRGSQATQKKDKVFGLLGLCREMEDGQIYGIEGNYSLSDEDTYIRTAVSILSRRRDLDLFAALRLQRDDKYILKLPSWVPD